MAKPLVAITGPEHGAWWPRHSVAAIVRWFGGSPKQVRPSDIEKDQLVKFDALVVTGGHDVDPVLYAAQPEVTPRYDEERDAFEAKMIKAALARHVPLLGICRGAQLFNVVLGGTLWQSLKDKRKITSHRWTVLPLKTLKIDARSKLELALGARQCRINSLHNQAIDKLGDGLSVSGRDLDGIVQAIELPSEAFALGVQWHPEFLLPLRKHRRLFQCLIEAARQSD